MELGGVNVLVDGYNLEMQKGTGIKTYGVNLVNTLMYLGANVDILCSRNINTDNAFLNEVLFFDNQSSRNISQIQMLMLAIKKWVVSAKNIPITSYVIKSDNDIVFKYLEGLGNIFNDTECYTLANNLYKLFKIQYTAKIPKRVDVWHTTYPVPIKIRNAKRITTIHDLIPLKLPYTTLDDKKFFFNLVKDSIKDSELILTVSESARQDLLQRFDADPDKVILTYQPIVDNSSLVKDELIDGVLKRYSLEAEKYILFVGAIEPKKNVGRLIDAYISLDADMKLVIVGKKAWLWENELDKLERVLGKNYSRKVKLLDYLPRMDLSYLYKGAFCFVFPSLYEGFGLPPLEAMSLGCPVITSNISSLPEVCEDAAIYTDPYNSGDIKDAIERLINSPQLRSQLIEAGKERIKFFSMENYSKNVYRAYRSVI
jgi:glycosyltransferase involved in cell wall biosynthesis